MGIVVTCCKGIVSIFSVERDERLRAFNLNLKKKIKQEENVNNGDIGVEDDGSDYTGYGSTYKVDFDTHNEVRIFLFQYF
jgi:hypothetical protein